MLYCWQQLLYEWKIYPIRLENLSALPFTLRQQYELPGVFRGVFNVAEPRDTFLSLPGWNKGLAWVNGFLPGTILEPGPQKTLVCACPAPASGRE